MNIVKTNVLDLYILEPRVIGDNRGWFMESWSQRTMEENGLHFSFVQDNHSFSAAKGTLRGLHIQKGASAQAKLVRCCQGAVLDVAVDVRKGSPTYMKWTAVELSAGNFRQLLIPRGFLHGFVTLTDNVEFLYKADNFYNHETESTVLWNDPELAVDWGIDHPIVNEKDAQAKFFAEYEFDFLYEGTVQSKNKRGI